MSRTLIYPFVCALVGAMWFSLNSDVRPFEERFERALISEQLAASQSTCMVSQSVTDKADVALLSICLVHGMDAFLAVTKYRESGLKLFALYGQEPELRRAIERYGSQVIPVLSYFLENGSAYYKSKQAIGDVVTRLWMGEGLRWQYSNITREQIGLIALDHIAQRGNEILVQFEVVDDVAKWRPVTSVLVGTTDLFLSGVLNLERILVRAERMPTLIEVAEAGVEAFLVAGALKGVAKAARSGSLNLYERGSLRSSVRSAYGALKTVDRTGRRVGPYALAYIAVTQPDLIASAGGWIAKQLGFPRLVGVFTIYAMGLYLIFQFFVTPLVIGWIALSSCKLVRWSFEPRRSYVALPRDHFWMRNKHYFRA